MGEIVIEQAEGGKLFKASGEFGLADSPAIHKELVEALRLSDSCLTLDLDAVERVDLTFIQLLLSLTLQARADGKRVALPSGLPERIMQAAEYLGVSLHEMENAFIFQG